MTKSLNQNKFTGFAAFFSSVIVVTAAQAQESGLYANIGAGFATSNVDEIEPAETQAGLIVVRGGYNLNRYIGLEAEGSFTVLSPGLDDDGVIGASGALNLSRSFAGYLTARYPVTNSISVFLRGGYHRTRLRLRSVGLDQSASFDNAAFGGGATYHWGRSGVRVDYTVLNLSRINQTAEGIDQRVIGVSFVRNF